LQLYILSFSQLISISSIFLGGGNAEYVAVHEDLVMPLPSGMSYRDAAAIPEVWLTAYQLLFTVGE
jgi:tumor protein p53-inducible protein 3